MKTLVATPLAVLALALASAAYAGTPPPEKKELVCYRVEGAVMSVGLPKVATDVRYKLDIKKHSPLSEGTEVPQTAYSVHGKIVIQLPQPPKGANVAATSMGITTGTVVTAESQGARMGLTAISLLTPEPNALFVDCTTPSTDQAPDDWPICVGKFLGQPGKGIKGIPPSFEFRLREVEDEAKDPLCGFFQDGGDLLK